MTHTDRYDSYEEYEGDEPTFERLRKRTANDTSLSSSRRQAGKKWGRETRKFLKEQSKLPEKRYKP